MDSVSLLLTSEKQKVLNMSLYRGVQMYPTAGQIHREIAIKIKKAVSHAGDHVTFTSRDSSRLVCEALLPEEGNCADGAGWIEETLARTDHKKQSNIKSSRPGGNSITSNGAAQIQLLVPNSVRTW